MVTWWLALEGRIGRRGAIGVVTTNRAAPYLRRPADASRLCCQILTATGQSAAPNDGSASWPIAATVHGDNNRQTRFAPG
jgi:hypothetical protein